MRIDSLVSAYERDRAVRFLGYHRDSGALDEAGYAERLRRAGAVETSPELDALFKDLPPLTDLAGDAGTPAQRRALMEDLRALGGYAQPGEPDHRVRSREFGDALVPVWGAGLSGWLPDRRDIGTAATTVMTVSGMASLWAAINGGAFVVWFWKALFTVVDPYPKALLEQSAIVLGICAVVLTAWLGLFRPRR